MKCVACGSRAGFNRAVVDLESDRELGGFCMRCERSEFGYRLERMEPSGADCAFCPAPGRYALPQWTPRRFTEAGVQVNRVDYTVSAATVRLCDGHLRDLKSIVDTGAGPGRSDDLD